MPTERIVFTDGVVRAEGAPLSAPHDLRNAEVSPYAGVRRSGPLAWPEDDLPPDPADARFPVRQANQWVAARAWARRGRLLYATIGTPAEETADPTLEVYPAGSGVPESDLPRITNVTVTPDGSSVSSVDADRYILYILIPVNDRDEAGPWAYAGHFTGASSDLPTLNIDATPETAYVEVYRTLEIPETPEGGELAWHYAGRTAVAEGGGGQSSISFDAFASPSATDIDTFELGELTNNDQNFEDADLSGTDLVGWTLEFTDLATHGGTLETFTDYEVYAQSNNEVSIKEPGAADGSLSFDGEEITTVSQEEGPFGDPVTVYDCARVTLTPPNPPSGGSASFTDRKKWSLSEDSEGEQVHLPGEDAPRLDRAPNQHAVVDGNPRSPTARTMHWTGGVMYYGGGAWPTKEPAVTYLSTGGDNPTTVYLQLEYETARGARFGPVRTIDNVDAFVAVVADAETRLNIYVDDGGTTRQYARVNPDPYGAYTRGSVFTFTSQSSYSGTAREPDPVTAYIDEPDAVFLSAGNRPLEVTFDQFTVPEGQQVRLIAPARLAEEEGIRAYEFYVGTDRAIYVARPDDRKVALDAVTTDWGVKLSTLQHPVYASVPGGAFVVGTDGILHALSGRRTDSIYVRGTEPWKEIETLLYAPERRDLLVGTDAGLWAYDLDRQGVFGQRDLWVAHAVRDDERSRAMLFTDGRYEVEEVEEDGDVVLLSVSTDATKQAEALSIATLTYIDGSTEDFTIETLSIRDGYLVIATSLQGSGTPDYVTLDGAWAALGEEIDEQVLVPGRFDVLDADETNDYIFITQYAKPLAEAASQGRIFYPDGDHNDFFIDAVSIVNSQLRIEASGIQQYLGDPLEGEVMFVNLEWEVPPARPSVTTQPVTLGGDEINLERITVDYEKEEYDPGQRDTWARLRHAIRHPDVVPILENPADHIFKDHHEAPAPRSYPVYPGLRGRAHQLTVSGFDALYVIDLVLDSSP